MHAGEAFRCRGNRRAELALSRKPRLQVSRHVRPLFAYSMRRLVTTPADSGRLGTHLKSTISPAVIITLHACLFLACIGECWFTVQGTVVASGPPIDHCTVHLIRSSDGREVASQDAELSMGISFTNGCWPETYYLIITAPGYQEARTPLFSFHRTDKPPAFDVGTIILKPQPVEGTTPTPLPG